MKVLFYTEVAFALSETFLYNQIYSTNKFEAIILCNKIQNQSTFKFFNHKIIKINLVPISFLDRLLSYLYRMIQRTGIYSFPWSSIKQIEYILINEGIDIIHCNYGNNALKFFKISKKLRIPLICHFHGYDASSLLNELEYKRQLKFFFNNVDATITVSYDMTIRLQKLGLICSKNKIIPYGTNIDFVGNNEISHINDQIVILHAGRITSKKGVPDLIRTFGNFINSGTVKNVKLEIIGDGDERIICEDLVKKLNLSKCVFFYGALPHSKVIQAMKAADIFILNSRVGTNEDMEGFPNTIIESMASGCAVISTIHAGIPDAIEDNVTGILVDEKDNLALEEAISRLCIDKNLRERLAISASEKAFKFYSLAKMRNEYLNFYNEIIYRY